MDSKRSIKALTTPAEHGEPGRDAAEASQYTTLELLDLWGHGSFPASDPPANW